MGKVVKFPSARALSDSASLAEMLLCNFLQQYLSLHPREDLQPCPTTPRRSGALLPAPSAVFCWDLGPGLGPSSSPACCKVCSKGQSQFWGEPLGRKRGHLHGQLPSRLGLIKSLLKPGIRLADPAFETSFGSRSQDSAVPSEKRLWE